MPNNYENPDFGIIVSVVFPNKKMINTEGVISHSDYKSQKFFSRNKSIFYNVRIDSKKDIIASCNEEDLEGEDHGSEPSVVVLFKMTGFFIYPL